MNYRIIRVRISVLEPPYDSLEIIDLVRNKFSSHRINRIQLKFRMKRKNKEIFYLIVYFRRKTVLSFKWMDNLWTLYYTYRITELMKRYKSQVDKREIQ